MRIPRPRLVSAAFGCLAAFTLILALAGCRFGDRGSITINSVTFNRQIFNEIGQGESVVVRVLYQTSFSVKAVTAVTATDVRGEPAEGVHVEIGEGGNSTDLSIVEISVDATAPPRPFYLTLRGDLAGNAGRAFSNSIPIYIHIAGAGAAPRIVSFTPDRVTRDVPFFLSIAGLNFDSTTRLVLDALDLTRSQPVLDVAANTLDTELRFNRVGKSGLILFHVETAAGSSEEYELNLRAEYGPPQLTGLFPNYGTIGQRITVTAAGNDFFVNSLFVSTDPALRVLDGLRVFDRRVLTVPVQVRQNAAFDVPVEVESLGGTSEQVVLFQLKGVGFAGPTIAQISPPEITAGSVAELLVEGRNFTAKPGTFVKILPTRSLPTPIFSPRFLPPSIPGRDHGVAQFTVAPNVTGTFYLALSTADGLNTEAVPIQIVAPELIRPFVRDATPGTIERGTTGQPEVITGERLADVTSVIFDQPGVTATIVEPRDPTGTSLNVLISATSDAPITGDRRTTFTARRGPTGSNEAGYIVTGVVVTPPSPPRIDLAAPNFVYPGETALTVLLGGVNFVDNDGFSEQPATLSLEPPGAATINGPFTEVENELIFLKLDVHSPALGSTVTVRATHPPGSPLAGTGSFNLKVRDPAAPGPRIQDARPIDSTIFNSTAQLRLTGTDFGANGPNDIVRFFGNGRTGSDIRSVRVFSPSDPAVADQSVVVQFEITNIRESLDLFYFAVQRADLVSNAVQRVATRSRSGEPLVARASVGEIRRPAPGQPPTEVRETLFGENLNNVVEIVFPNPDSGVAVIDIVPNPNGLGTSLTATFLATADATLTGDDLTTFRARTNDGKSSNPAGYVVLPALP